jgi:hypothetical protein
MAQEGADGFRWAPHEHIEYGEIRLILIWSRSIGEGRELEELGRYVLCGKVSGVEQVSTTAGIQVRGCSHEL